MVQFSFATGLQAPFEVIGWKDLFPYHTAFWKSAVALAPFPCHHLDSFSKYFCRVLFGRHCSNAVFDDIFFENCPRPRRLSTARVQTLTQQRQDQKHHELYITKQLSESMRSSFVKWSQLLKLPQLLNAIAHVDHGLHGHHSVLEQSSTRNN